MSRLIHQGILEFCDRERERHALQCALHPMYSTSPCWCTHHTPCRPLVAQLISRHDNNDEAVRAIEFERCKRPVRSLSTTWSLKTFSCSKCRKQILGEPFKMQRETENRLGQVGALFCSKTCRKQFYDSRAKKLNKKGQSDNTKSRCGILLSDDT